MRANLILSHKNGYRHGYVEFYRTLMSTATYFSSILEDLDSFNMNMIERNKVDNIYREFMTLFIEEFPTFGQQYALPNGKRGCPAMHIFCELSRARFIMKHQSLVDTKRIYIQTNEEPQDDGGLFLMSVSKCSTEFWNTSVTEEKDATVLILSYNQEQLINLLIIITQKMDEMAYAEELYNDFNRLTQALFTRNSVLLCEACTAQTLNLSNFRSPVKGDDTLFVPNRDYIMLCTLYFNSIFRRHYYFKLLEPNIKYINLNSNAYLDTLKKWIKTDVCMSLGDDGFEDIYGVACEESFAFTGDKAWFQYRYPERPATKGPVLDCIRPLMAKHYFTKYRVSKEPVLAAAEGHRDDLQGKISRYFILLAVDQYFRNTHNAHWLDAVLIKNESIELNQHKLYKNRCPCLLQVLGDYYVYCNGYIYPSNTIYQTIYIWFYLLREHYNCTLFKINVRHITEYILNNSLNHITQEFSEIQIDRL